MPPQRQTNITPLYKVLDISLALGLRDVYRIISVEIIEMDNSTPTKSILRQ